jgi:hypothetical protein
MVFIPVNFTWIEDQIKNGKLKLRFEINEKDRITIFVSSAEEWVRFLKDYGDDESGWAFPKLLYNIYFDFIVAFG